MVNLSPLQVLSISFNMDFLRRQQEILKFIYVNHDCSLKGNMYNTLKPYKYLLSTFVCLNYNKAYNS
jgi:hypothetical protein